MEFSKKEIIISSWNIMKNHLSLLILIILFIFGLNLLLSVIQDKILGEITAQSILFTAAAYLFQMGLSLGMLRIYLKIIREKEVDFGQLFGSFHLLISYLLATIVMLALIVVAASPGIILLLSSIASDWENLSNLDSFSNLSMFLAILLILVPTVYLSIRLQFYDYFIVDEECGIIESIQKSAAISKGHVMELFLLGAVLAIIILISLIPLGAGLILSIPLGGMATSYVYLKLKDAN